MVMEKDITDIFPENPEQPLDQVPEGDSMHRMVHLSGMYKDWFLDYASYVILERAVPNIFDGLKPVQRRILHSMKRLDDGRFNKVANIIGHTMQFHPHGDASIGDALVQIGQKDLLINTQGNWGNIHTGDNAAAPRYIEARLSKFALEVVFNPKTTEWKLSYDGRNKEPVHLPVKFPLLLAQGAEGIAVGLASKIFPHNLNELIDASIAHLSGLSFELYPDFPTGGLADCSRYNDGLRGGVIRVRARIKQIDKKTLAITELPYGHSTTSLIDSVIKANDKGKIKIRKIEDNTAEFVEIIVHLAPGISPDKTIDALYAFTDCEIPISPNCCVIENDRPRFLGVSEMLRISTNNTVDLLKKELEIREQELIEELHMSTLEKIFIEKKIYRQIETSETWEEVISAIEQGLKPYRKKFLREITTDDIVKLTEIKIKRISKFDSRKADDSIKALNGELAVVRNNLAKLVPYAINYFKQLKKKYGAVWDRKTELRGFDVIEAARVVMANEKLYVNRKEGFVGTGLKKDEYVCECSDIDDIIIVKRDGTFIVTRISDKSFVGKDIAHVAVFLKNDTRTIYNIVYRDGKAGNTFVKRANITGLTRDKEYTLTRGTAQSKILYISANPNGEAEVIRVSLVPRPRLKTLIFDFDFGSLEIKSRSAIGNILTRYPVHKIGLLEKGVSTLGGTKIWYDDAVNRLFSDERGTYLGEFHDDEKIMVITKAAYYRLSSYDLSNHFEDDLLRIEKYNPKKIFTVVYFDAEQQYYYVKRFPSEPTEKAQRFIDEHPDSYMIMLIEHKHPRLEITFGGKHNKREKEIIDVGEFIAVKSDKAKGKRISAFEVESIKELEPLIFEDETIDDEESGFITHDNTPPDEEDSQMTLNF
jgi:topoisomerase-4 subunit A